MSPERIRILLVEDSPAESRFTREMLAETRSKGNFPTEIEVVAADRLSEALKRLAETPVDAVLTDLGLPDSQGIATFLSLQAAAPSMPIVILSGSGVDEPAAIEAVQKGAQDYLTKGMVNGLTLARVLRYSVERKGAQEAILRLNRELAQRMADLTAANNELNTFTHSASHDLRAPLRIIAGYCDHFRKRYGDRLDAEGLGYLERIVDGARRMGDIIDALLRLSRVSRAEMRVQDVDLAALARLSAEELQRADPARRVRFAIADKLPARGDAALLRIALDNLIGNAWKFTSRSDDGVIEIDLAPGRDGGTAFVVRDNGVGFDMKHAPRVFRAFERLHPQSEFPGSGIGLATVERIIGRHGGRIWVEAAPGRGAAFYFTL